MPLPEQAVQPLTSLVVGLINLKSAPSPVYGSRYHSDLFRELPARDLYPDYYVLIKEPRSLNGVMVSALALVSRLARELTLVCTGLDEEGDILLASGCSIRFVPHLVQCARVQPAGQLGLRGCGCARGECSR